jgi:hypothetical protein
MRPRAGSKTDNVFAHVRLWRIAGYRHCEIGRLLRYHTSVGSLCPVTLLSAFRKERARRRTPEGKMQPSTQHRFVIHQLSERIAVVRMGSRDEVPAWASTDVCVMRLSKLETMLYICAIHKSCMIPGPLQRRLRSGRWNTSGVETYSGTEGLRTVYRFRRSGEGKR